MTPFCADAALPELLSPAGDRERLEAAVRFGADAVYLGGKAFGMRGSPPNFTAQELADAVGYAHARGVRVYLTCNTVVRNEECAGLPEFLEQAGQAGVDGLIVTDLGVMRMAQHYAPGVEIHISTQAGVANFATARALFELGAKRVILARELTLSEIAEIRAKTPKELTLEAFVHGAMCVSFSGRCLLSNYFTGRDANRGECAQPCRWKYALVEETRPGRPMPVFEGDGGSYILNSRDLCMISHVPELVAAGVGSFKIEGRAKSAYYAAVTTNAYRWALDEYARCPDAPLPGWILEEPGKVSHREYCTGFYFGGGAGQVYENGGYVRAWEQIAVCCGMRGGCAVLSQRNRFFRGDEAEVLQPGRPPYRLKMDGIADEDGVPVESANHAQMTVLLPVETPVPPGAIFRRKISDV